MWCGINHVDWVYIAPPPPPKKKKRFGTKDTRKTCYVSYQILNMDFLVQGCKLRIRSKKHNLSVCIPHPDKRRHCWCRNSSSPQTHTVPTHVRPDRWGPRLAPGWGLYKCIISIYCKLATNILGYSSTQCMFNTYCYDGAILHMNSIYFIFFLFISVYNHLALCYSPIMYYGLGWNKLYIITVTLYLHSIKAFISATLENTERERERERERAGGGEGGVHINVFTPEFLGHSPEFSKISPQRLHVDAILSIFFCPVDEIKEHSRVVPHRFVVKL